MSEINGKKVKLFSLSSNLELAQDISKATNIPLGDCEVLKFADGEISININETVRGHHVFVVQSTNEPVNDNLMELLIMIDALKRASASSINVVLPYYGYSRQDRKAKSRQPISAKLVADLLQVAGANRVIAMDLHAAQIQGFFNIPIDNFLGMPTLANYVMDMNLENLIVVSPDAGGVTRAREFAKVLNVPMAIIDKRRPEPNKAKVMNIIGNVEGKNCLIVDDMCDTGGSMCAATDALLEAGALKVFAAVTHPVLSRDGADRIKNSNLEKLICTNTIKLPEAKQNDKIIQLSVGKVLGHGILKILNDEPLSGLFTYSYDPSKREML